MWVWKQGCSQQLRQKPGDAFVSLWVGAIASPTVPAFAGILSKETGDYTNTSKTHPKHIHNTCKLPSQCSQNTKTHKQRIRKARFTLWFAHLGILAPTKRTPRENVICCVCFCGCARCCRFTACSHVRGILLTSSLHHRYMHFSWCVCCNTCPTHFIRVSNTFCDLNRNAFPRHFKRFVRVLEHPRS